MHDCPLANVLLCAACWFYKYANYNNRSRRDSYALWYSDYNFLIRSTYTGIAMACGGEVFGRRLLGEFLRTVTIWIA